jgi:tetratricopeptide (TPR) repeat protein
VLLDRKRVKFWQRIVFGGMAVLMAAFLVFGYSGALSSCQKSGGALSSTKELDAEIEALEQRVQADPTDVAAWGELGDAYLQRSRLQDDLAASEADTRDAIAAYEQQVSLLENVKDDAARKIKREALENLADVYLQSDDIEMALDVYGRLTSLAPKNAQYFFDMGYIAANVGDTNRALLAFNRYIELEPDSADAEFAKDWIAANSPDSEGSPQ